MPTALEDKDQVRPKEGSGSEQDAENAAEQQNEKVPADPAKCRRTLLIGVVRMALLVAAGVAWWLYAQTYESTDDAQIDGHLNPIASRVAGTIRAFYMENNQRVEAANRWLTSIPLIRR